MRKGTKAFVGVVSLGVIAAGYQVGLAAEVSNGFSATAPVVDQPAAASPAASPTETATSTPSPVEATVIPAAPAKTTAPAPISTPKASSSAPAPAPAQNSAGTTKDGDAVRYQYGTVQVAVTKSGGKITAVTMLQEGATGGRQATFTYLVDLAIQANGSNFGNLSGATYTVDAFKLSLESALAKF